jgi:GT2 family glycosyltransferase
MPISVIVASYNRAALLRDCLQQLSGQQYEPGDEVIVVDNASTDETPAVIGAAAATFPVPLRAIRETTPGKTAALNAGIAVAGGDVLALTDDDVLVDASWIATIRELFRDPEPALLGGRVEPRWEAAKVPAWLRIQRDGRYTRMASPLALQHYGPRQALGARTAVGANLVVRREVVDAVGGFNAHLGRLRGTLLCGEDHDFCQRVVSAGYQAVYDPRLTVRHWVPADRTRLGYYARWFFWSGVTSAMLGGAVATGPSLLGTPRYVWGQAVRGLGRMLREIARGARAEAVAALTEVAFAAGFIWKRGLGVGWQEISSGRRQAPQLPASTQSPALQIPGVETGKPDRLKATEPEQRRGQSVPAGNLVQSLANSRVAPNARREPRQSGM